MKKHISDNDLSFKIDNLKLFNDQAIIAIDHIYNSLPSRQNHNLNTNELDLLDDKTWKCRIDSFNNFYNSILVILDNFKSNLNVESISAIGIEELAGDAGYANSND